MLRIKKPADWWKLVEDQWVALCRIMQSFLPSDQLIVAEQAKKDRDWETLWLCFQRAWGAAPDSPAIHDIEGWFDLCDLCSETWVFEGALVDPVDAEPGPAILHSGKCPVCGCSEGEDYLEEHGKCHCCVDDVAAG